MQKAIVSGSTGLVGSNVVRCLLENNISVLCLGRRILSDEDLIRIFGQLVQYVVTDMTDLEALPDKLKTTDFEINKECVFFNFAWGGNTSLTDGGFNKQFENAIYTSKSVNVAAVLGCSKFVNCGTIQETIAELSIENHTNYNNSQRDYTISKIASRDMCLMIAYLEKIDYVHTRLSVPLNPKVENSGYIRSTLGNIMSGREYSKPKNNQLFDITHIDDVAYAYYLIGLNGQNKSDYYIGAASPMTLNQYFDIAEKFYNGEKVESDFAVRSSNIFDNQPLIEEANFGLNYNFTNILEQVKDS
jgi:nucleoside-diphosphate-sugar epimerase